MFEQLFFRSDALTRQLSAPLVGERRQYNISFSVRRKEWLGAPCA